MRCGRLLLQSIGFLAVLGLATVTSPASQYSYARIVRLSLVNGDVQISRPGHSKWEKAFANMPMEQGFTIGTNNGRAEIQFEDGTNAWIGSDTILQFTELALSDGGRITKLTLTRGTASFFADPKRADSFAVVTPYVQIHTPKRSLFRVDVLSEGTSVSDFQGEATVDSPAGRQTLVKGKTLGYNWKLPDRFLTDQNPKPDIWDRWVNGREQSLMAGASQALAYSHAPFSYGLADLSNYGIWNYDPCFGYGWQPLGIASGWAPFMDGQWMFYPGLGWTWLSDEPWGWVPYHFGSWVFSPDSGWLWLPSGMGFWNPAPVSWYQTGGGIGWSPSLFGGGCGSAGFALPYQNFVARPQANTKPQPRGKLPVSPRFLLTNGSKRLGHGGSVRIVSASQAGAKLRFLPVPPMRNGKISSRAEADARAELASGGTGATAGGALAFRGGNRVLVPTAPGLAQLRLAIGLAAPKSGPAIHNSAPVALTIANAAARPASMPRPPAPMRGFRGSFSATSRSETMPANPNPGPRMSAPPMRSSMPSSGPGFSGPRSSPSPPPAAAHSTGGRPPL